MVSDSEDMELEDPPRKRRKKTAPLPRRKPTRKPPELDDQLGGRGLNDDNLLELLNEESFFTKHKDRAKRILAPLSSFKKRKTKDHHGAWETLKVKSKETMK